MITVIDNAAPTAILDFIRTIAENKETWHFKRPINVTFKDKRPRLDIFVDGEAIDNFIAGLAIGALMSTHDRGGHVYFHPEILHCGISMKDSVTGDITHQEHIDEHEHDHHHEHDHNISNRLRVLFLLNTDWKEEWKGGVKYDTEVYNFKPGSAIIFDPRVPHSADQIIGDEKRLTLDFTVRKTTL